MIGAGVENFSMGGPEARTGACDLGSGFTTLVCGESESELSVGPGVSGLHTNFFATTDTFVANYC